jgi:hypothetical protein
MEGKQLVLQKSGPLYISQSKHVLPLASAALLFGKGFVTPWFKSATSNYGTRNQYSSKYTRLSQDTTQSLVLM